MLNLPKSRNHNLVVQKSNKELLIYDLETNRVFCLNETAAKVWNSCDGKNTLSFIAKQNNLPEEIVAYSLEMLKNEKLMANKSATASSVNIFTRRQAISSALKTAIALPIITSVVAPQSVAAQSGAACTPNGGVVNLSPQPDLNTCTNAYFAAEAAGAGCCNKVTNITFNTPRDFDCFGICPA